MLINDDRLIDRSKHINDFDVKKCTGNDSEQGVF